MSDGHSLEASETPPATVPIHDSASEKAFPCVHCLRQFTRKENLNRHLKTHNTLRSHRCRVCDRGFTRSDLLKRHEALHDGSKETARRASDADPPTKRLRVDVSDHGQSSDHLLPPQDDIESVTPPDKEEIVFAPTVSTSAAGVESDSFPPAFNEHSVSETVPSLPGLTPQDPYFDFSTFVLPSEDGMPEGTDHWFSLDFYSALQETDWEQMLGLQDQPFGSMSSTTVGGPEIRLANEDAHQGDVGIDIQPQQNHAHSSGEEGMRDDHYTSGRVSRLSSPPNEASYEDRTPFAWNPRSRRIAEAKDIVLAPEDPLLANHNPRFDISEATFQRVKMFLLPQGNAFLSSMRDSFNLPSLEVTNAFIRVYFERFAPQAPILHKPTLDTNKDLPPALLAIIIVIGAIYSRLRSTRRFAILALDRVRRHLQLVIEDDNTLMRDPKIIFAAALVCYTGLWCGNKRAFELAEIFRGAVVTYIRRLETANPSLQNHDATFLHGLSGVQQHELKARWLQWIKQESRKRLSWFVYTIDCQFPSLLNISPLMSPTEVSGWDCPCEEEFWTSRSARHWKSLLGIASMPPSRSFAAAIAPFNVPCLTCACPVDKLHDSGVECLTPPLNLNAWSYFLVMMTLQGRIFQHGEERLLLRKLIAATDHADSDDGERNSDNAQHVLDRLEKQGTSLESTLSLWSQSYASQLSGPQQSDPTTLYFHHASTILCRLSSACVNVPITDLQEAIGKGGNAMIQPAMTRLSDWVAKNPVLADDMTIQAVETIEWILWFQQKHKQEYGKRTSKKADLTIDSSPYNSITLFLSYIMLWAYAKVANDETKRSFATVLRQRKHEFPSISLQKAILTALDVEDNTSSSTGGPKVLFKHAAQVLTRFGDWGCSLNLALLLHWRSEM